MSRDTMNPTTPQPDNQQDPLDEAVRGTDLEYVGELARDMAQPDNQQPQEPEPTIIDRDFQARKERKITEQEEQRIREECAECLKDREEFASDEGIRIVECDHCRDKMNLIEELCQLRSALEASEAARKQAKEETKRESSSALALLCADHAQVWYTERNQIKVPDCGCIVCDTSNCLEQTKQERDAALTALEMAKKALAHTEDQLTKRLEAIESRARAYPLAKKDAEDHWQEVLKTREERDAALAALKEAQKDTERLDYLEGELDRENEAMDDGGVLPDSLFRRNQHITRAAIDRAWEGKA